MPLNRWFVTGGVGLALGCGTPSPERPPVAPLDASTSVDVLMSTLIHGEIEPCG